MWCLQAVLKVETGTKGAEIGDRSECRAGKAVGTEE